MLESSEQRILENLGPEDLVLDVGGWAKPFMRADWVMDLQPYATRGLYHYDREIADERFSSATWVVRDICEREPWPFPDGRFDFAVCAHTLEDLRDPLWVCAELQRVARAGYIEVPSRCEEQAMGVEHGGSASWAGWSHHRWLCDVDGQRIQFVHKPHLLHATPDYHFTPAFHRRLTPAQRVEQLWWSDSFQALERIFVDGAEMHEFLHAPIAAREPPGGRGTWSGRSLRRLRMSLRARAPS